MSLFGNNGTLILLHKGLNSIKKASKYDLVLSPQFYISKREKLPIKYAFQAKKVAPSILEEYLPSEYGYEYIVLKDGDSWLFFAYSPKDVEEFLKSCCNINPNKINKIYFADQLKPILRKLPIGIDEKNALTLIDNSATIVPRSMLDSDRYAKFTKKLRPKQSFNFKPSSKSNSDNKVSKGAVFTIISILLLSVAFLAEALSYKKAIKVEQESLDKIYTKYPELKGKLIRDSIKKKYENIEKKERAVRELLDKLSQLTSKKSILDKVDIQNGKFTAQFRVEPKEIKRVEAIATAANLKVKRINSTLLVEGVLK